MKGMKEGVSKTGCFLLFLSKGVMARPYVQFELQTALELGKKIVLVHGEGSPCKLARD